MKNIVFRKTTIGDVEAILEIFDGAKAYLRGFNIDQWQNGYPDQEVVLADIHQGISYVAVNDEMVIGVITVTFDGEPSYDTVEGDGFSIDCDRYGVIHRIAVNTNSRNSGVSTFLLTSAEALCVEKNVHCLRLDTHTGNLAMQRFLVKNNFAYCGEINIVSDGDTLRYVYEKSI